MTIGIKKQLTELVCSLPVVLGSPVHLIQPGVWVNHIAYDSRKVVPGSLFVALTGGSVDGHHYISDAIGSGASAIVGMHAFQDLAVPYIQVPNSREALAWLSAAFYDFPARKMTVIGVTGTDGKTTTSNLIFNIIRHAGCNAGMISTVNAILGDVIVDTGYHVTTPEAPEIQQFLSNMVEKGLTHVVLEATSHGLAQHRVTGCEFDIAVVTNITHEHLDYHGNLDEYRAAKGRLFSGLSMTSEKDQGKIGLSILNHDDSSFEYLRSVAPDPIKTYSLSEGADYWARDVELTVSGMKFVVIDGDNQQDVESRLVGNYNLSNILAAYAATVSGLGIDRSIAAEGVAKLSSIPGRMEAIDLGQDFTAIVDFAHTPNALKNAIQTVREMTSGRVITIFGSAGLRDKEKRRIMADTSIKLSDITILTAEDPRTESLDEILEEMAEAARNRGGLEDINFFRVLDRGNAIRLGIQLARTGDLVIACGKGHEQSMCFGEIEYPWDDRAAMKAALAEHLGIPNLSMPYLPTS